METNFSECIPFASKTPNHLSLQESKTLHTRKKIHEYKVITKQKENDLHFE